MPKAMSLTQTYGGLLDPYSVSFYYRYSGAEHWKWCYVSHEDFYWWSGSIVADTDSGKAAIMHGTRRMAVFDWGARTLTFDSERGVVQAPQAEITGSPLAPV